MLQTTKYCLPYYFKVITWLVAIVRQILEKHKRSLFRHRSCRIMQFNRKVMCLPSSFCFTIQFSLYISDLCPFVKDPCPSILWVMALSTSSCSISCPGGRIPYIWNRWPYTQGLRGKRSYSNRCLIQSPLSFRLFLLSTVASRATGCDTSLAAVSCWIGKVEQWWWIGLRKRDSPKFSGLVCKLWLTQTM